jgi:preprotein translocase subunit SecG
MIKDFGLPQGATILIQIAIVFAIIFTVIIAILGNIYEDQKIKEEQE